MSNRFFASFIRLPDNFAHLILNDNRHNFLQQRITSRWRRWSRKEKNAKRCFASHHLLSARLFSASAFLRFKLM
jgi:hypothetical protein